MANIVEYTMSLNDQMSAKLTQIGVSAGSVNNVFDKMQAETSDFQKNIGVAGKSVDNLHSKINVLHKDSDLIQESTINDVKRLDHEVNNVAKSATKLNNVSGSKFGNNMRSAISNLPFAELITNPIAQAGLAIFTAGKMSLGFSENMGKVNTTAQLSAKELETLGATIKVIGRDAGADLSGVPVAFEKILSQTGDAELSVDILRQTLKGAEAGFTDTATVADALANTLSIVGKENTNATEVLDTLFAAKRVGAGEFKDFAQYVPGLVASGQALGKGFKESAGLFSFMTGKGIEASKSATLIENAYTALGKSDITKGMELAGVSVFNTDGSMKQIDEIMASMSAKLSAFGNNDQAKSNFLESIGLKDAQAKQAFMVMSSDASKLTEALQATASAAGEADKAFAMGETPMRKMRQLWSNMQYIIIGVGDVITSILYPALYAVTAIVSSAVDVVGWFTSGLEAGNAAALLLAAGIGFATVALTVNYLLTKRAVIQAALVNAWNIVQATTMGVLTGAIWAQNAAWLANPIGLIVAGVVLLTAGIVYLVSLTEGWTETWNNTMSVIGDTISIVADKFMIAFNKMRQSWYAFKDTIGLGDSAENKSEFAKLEKDTADRMDSLDAARKRRAETTVWQVKWKADESATQTDGTPATKKAGLASAIGGVGNSGSASSTTSSSVSGSGSGGGVSVKIGNLIGSLTFNGMSEENSKMLENQITEGIVRALNLAVARS